MLWLWQGSGEAGRAAAAEGGSAAAETRGAAAAGRSPHRQVRGDVPRAHERASRRLVEKRVVDAS